MVMTREDRINVYRQTIAVCNQGWYIDANGNRIDLPDDTQIAENTQFYDKEFTVDDIKANNQPTEITVINTDTINAAHNLLLDGYNPVALNFANRHNPGGGVIGGSRAQEESLFRATNLFRSLYQYIYYAEEYGVKRNPDRQYPMDRHFGGIYTPNATVFRDSNKDYVFISKPYQISFIAVAALNRPRLIDDKFLNDKDAQTTKDKIRTILRIGLKNSHDAIVLGAFGCGAFHNPPAHLAKIFHQVIEEKEFKDKYKKIVFAIIEDHNSTNGNFKPFYDEFNNSLFDTENTKENNRPKFTPNHINSLKDDEVFVFGSNLQGMHAGGAARAAVVKFGAIMGQGVGMQGQSYAIPTMHGGVETIKPYVDEFIEYAKQHKDKFFYVTRIGCGIAGFLDEEIAPLFVKAVGESNICLPQSFADILYNDK